MDTQTLILPTLDAYSAARPNVETLIESLATRAADVVRRSELGSCEMVKFAKRCGFALRSLDQGDFRHAGREILSFINLVSVYAPLQTAEADATALIADARRIQALLSAPEAA
jgi:hypothetical protein